MSGTDQVKSTNFDGIFECSEKPSVCLDCSYLDDDQEGVHKVIIDFEDDDNHEYTVRKFSTHSAGRKLVDEGQEKRSSISRVCDQPQLFCTAVLGSYSTGKTSLCRQVTTSTCINTYEVQEMMEMETEIGVELDGWQCRLRLVDLPGSFCLSLLAGDQICACRLDRYNPSVLVVVFAVDDRGSVEKAGTLLAVLRREGRLVDKVGVLVANKADLARSRVVTEVEGKTLAGRYDVSYMETSSGINYNVDELLAKIVQQLQEKHSVLGSRKKMSVTEKFKDLVVRRRSRESSQEKDVKERKVS